MTQRPEILLLNLPFLLEREFIDYPYHFNYNLLANAASLRQNGLSVAVFDAFAQPDSVLHPLPDNGGWWMGCSFEAVQAALPTYQPQVVALFFHPFLFAPFNKSELFAFLADIRAAYPGVPVVLFDGYTGGMHYIDYNPAEYLGEDGADYLLRYETDGTLPELCRRLLAGERPTERLVLPGARLPMKSLPLPAYDLIDWDQFQAFLRECFSPHKLFDEFRAVGAVPYKIGRGCPYKCSFCSVNPHPDLEQKKPSFLDLESIEQQLIFLEECFHERRLYCLDEVANAHPRFEQVLALFNRRGWSYDFPNGMRAERLKAEHLDAMRGHVGTLSISAESGCQRVLDEIVGKGLRVEDIENVARLTHERGMPLLIHFMIGFPGESKAEINETLRFASRLWEQYGARPSVQFATAFPGTALDRLARGRYGQDLSRERNYYALPCTEPHLDTAGGATREELISFRNSFQTRLKAYGTPEKVIINLTYRCSNRCRFCATGDRVFIDGEYDKQIAILRSYREQGVRLVDFDGGEPTLYNRLFDVIREARAMGYQRVNLTTNGRKLKDLDYARKIVFSGITDLLISLHGPNAEVHTALVQQPAAYLETMQGIANVRKIMPPDLVFGINTTVTTQNYRHLETMAQLVVSLGIKKFNVQLLTPFGTVYTDVIYDMKQVAPYLRRVIERFGTQLDVQLINLPFCYMPGYEPYMMSDVFKLGRHMLFADSISGAVNLADYLGGRRYKTEQCDTCPYDAICNGFYDFSEDQETILPGLVEQLGKAGSGKANSDKTPARKS